MKKFMNKLICIITVMVLILNFSSTLIMAVSDEIENNKSSEELRTVSEERTFEDFKYQIENDENVEIVKYTGSEAELTIPSEIENLSVTKIQNSAFYHNKTIEKVILPENVKEIGTTAFSDCTLLKEVVLPDGLIKIGWGAFNDCINLEKINYPINLKQVEFGGTFVNCTKLTQIEVPEGVTELASNIFFRSSLVKVTLPSTLKKIGQNAFRENKTIETIKLPEGLTEIGDWAFSDCTVLNELVLPDGITTLGIDAFAKCVNLSKINYPINLKTGYAIFMGCENITEIIVPEGVTELPKGIFCLSSLTKVTLPSTLKTIGDQAFSENRVIETIVIPEGVTKIDKMAFNNCTLLNSIKLPETLKEIGNNAFKGATSIKEIILPNGLTTLDGYVFEGCTNLETINYPANLTDTGNGGIFKGCEKLSEITVPEGVTNLPSGIFSYSSLTRVNLPRSLEIIENNSFYGNKVIETITIPEYVTKIESGAFQKCTMLKKITLPESLKNIGTNAFSECTSIKEVILPEGLTHIGSYAFSDCSNLEKINYPKSLVYAGNGNVFGTCEKLKKIEVPEGVTELPDYIFSNSCLTRVKLPSTLKTIGMSAFSQNKVIKTITIPEGVTVIKSSAFSNCTELENVELPESLARLDNTVFRGCTKITEMVMPSNLYEVGYGCFLGNESVTLLCKQNARGTIRLIDDNLKNFIFYDDTKPTSSQILNYNQSSYNANFSTSCNGGNISVICEYAILDDMLNWAKSITIKIPNDAELIGQTLYVDKELCQDFTENSRENKITIPVKKAEGKITFNVRTQNNSNFVSYAVLNHNQSGSEYDIIGVINNEISAISIETASVTNKETISVTGSTKANKNVEIYINDNLVTTVNTNKVGSYRTNINLPNIENGKVYTVKAKTINDENQDIYAEKQVRYSLTTPTMSSFNMIYDGKTYDLLSNIKQTVIFTSRAEIKFEIKFTNSENVEDVYVTSERNNVTKRIKAKWSEERQAFVTSDYFDANRTYVPGRMNVYYTDKSSKQENSINITLSEEQQADLLDGATAELISETETSTEVRVNLKDDTTVSMKSDILTFEQAVRKVLSDSSADKVLNAQNSTRMRVKARGIPDSVKEQFLDMLLNEEIAYAQEEMKAIYFQKNVSPSELGVYLWDTTTDTVKETVISIGGEKVAGAFLTKVVGFTTQEVVEIGADKFCFNSLYGIYKSGKYFYDTDKKIESIRDSLRTPDVSIEDRARINKQLDKYETQAKTVATLKAICSFADAVITFSGLGAINPPLALALKATTFIFDNIVLELWQEGIDRDIAQLQGTPSDTSINWVIDPSGYVYEAGTNNRLKNVKCELYYLDEETGNEVFWNANEYDQQNPIYTDNQGRYAWDVPEGKWKVKYSLEGYETTSTDWMNVPPPQTDVNIGLTSIKKYILGDVDGNQKITTKDAKMVLQHIVKKIKLTAEQEKIADVDGNTKITTKDAKLILQYIVKKITVFPAEQN